MSDKFWVVCFNGLAILCFLSSTSESCAEFQFPGVDSSNTYTFTEGSHLELPFWINTEGCPPSSESYIITVSKNNTRNDFCKMLIYPNGSCVSFRPRECDCSQQQQHFTLQKTVDKNDSTTWTWKVSGGNTTGMHSITFNVQDQPLTMKPSSSVKTSTATPMPTQFISKVSDSASTKRPAVNITTTIETAASTTRKPKVLPQILELALKSPTINSSITVPVEVNSSVEVLCRYRKGDFHSTKAVLKNTHGEEMTPLHVTDRKNITVTRSVLENVNCDDFGDISCEVPRARRNVTTRLLVKCPPRYTEEVVKIFEGQAGDEMDLRFQVFTHTKEIRGCHVTKVVQGHAEGQGQGHNESITDEEPKIAWTQDCHQFASRVEMVSTLPDGTLRLLMDRARPEHSGTWNLTISNGEGSADFIFRLKVTGTMPEDEDYMVGSIIVTVVIIAVVVAMVVMVVRYREQVRDVMRRFVG